MKKVILLFCLFISGIVFAADPGWRRGVAPKISRKMAREKLENLKTESITKKQIFKTKSAVSGAETITEEIRALARALQHDPKLIYEFVHNHIDYVPYYGSMKGATLTLISESGNDFDQASLMIALLRESGFDAEYVYGTMTIPNGGTDDGYDMEHWLGIEPNTNLIRDVIFNGGNVAEVDETGTTLLRIWVKLTIDGDDYFFDPAFKKYENNSAHKNILEMIGYNRNQFLNAVGGRFSRNYVRDIDEEGLQNKLNEYTENFVNEIKEKYPVSDIKEILGDRKIIPEFIDELPAALRFPIDKWDEWPNVPASTDFVHSVYLEYGEIKKEFWVPEIAGKRIAIVYSNEYGEGVEVEQNLILHDNIFTGIIEKIEAPELPKKFLENVLLKPKPAKLSIPENYSNVIAYSEEEIIELTDGATVDFGILPKRAINSVIIKKVLRIRNPKDYGRDYFINFIKNKDDVFSFTELPPIYLAPKTGYKNINVAFKVNGSPGNKNGTVKKRMKPVSTNHWANREEIDLTAKVAKDPVVSTESSYILAFLNNPTTGKYYIKNKGDENLHILNMSKGKPDNDHFRFISGNNAGSISPGGQREITVEYKAKKHGIHTNAEIRINYKYDGVTYNKNTYGPMTMGLYGQCYYSFNNNFSNYFNEFLTTPTTRYLNKGFTNSCSFELHQYKPDSTPLLEINITNLTLTGSDADHYEIENIDVTDGYSDEKEKYYYEKLTINIKYLADSPGIHTDAYVVANCTYDSVPNIEMKFRLYAQTIKSKAQLWLDDEKIAEIDPPGDSPNDQKWLTVVNKHPYYIDYVRQTAYYNLRGIGTYVLVSAFGGSANGKLLKNRQQKLNEYIVSDLSMSSREVFTESLNIMGQTWFEQTALNKSLIGKLADILYIRHHRFGMAAQEEGFYVDIKSQSIAILPRKVAGKTLPFFWAGGPLASAMEHGVIEQLQYGKSAVSTVKLLQIANENHTPIFWVNNDNFHEVKLFLNGQNSFPGDEQSNPYSSHDIKNFKELVEDGATLVLPANSKIKLDDWDGKGYIAFTDNFISMSIGGDLYGGFSSEWGFLDPEDLSCEYYSDLINVWETVYPLSEDPVNLTSGALLFDRGDLSVGAAEPRGLHFGRSYSSDSYTSKKSMGYGWTHNYDMFAMIHSDTKAGLGKRTPIDAAALITASAVTLDLLENPQLKEWMASALIGNWAMDQLLENAVSVNLKNKILKYIKLPDGSYNPPPGITAELVEENGKFRLEERFGTKILFNENKKIEFWEDVDGNSMTFSYNSKTNIQKVTDCYGRFLTFNYSDEKLDSVSDSTGRNISFGYENDNLTSYTGPENSKWKYSYDDKHRMTSLTDPEGTITASNIYDKLGDVKTQITPRPNGNLDRIYNFYFSGYRNIEENPVGHQTVYYFDDKSRTTAIENQLGYKTVADYDSQNHIISQTDSKGNKSFNFYDAFNNLTNTTDTLGNKSFYEYDEKHQLVAVTDPLGNVTRYEYDSKHHPIKIIAALGYESSKNYYENGLPKTTTDTRGNTTTYTYDSYGNPKTVTYSDGGVGKFVYNKRGDLTQSTDPKNHFSSFTYDNRRLMLTATDPKGDLSSTEYNSFGKQISVTDKKGFTSHTSYTPSYKVNTVTAPDGGIISNVYDADDNLIATVDKRNNISKIFYDAAKRVTAVKDPFGNVTSNTYDKNNNLITTTDPLGNSASNIYDELNRVVQTVNPLGFSSYLQYDKAGRITNAIDALNRKTQIEFDALGRKITTIRSDKLKERFEYDSAGNMTIFVNANQQKMSFGFDEMNRISAITNALGYSESYTYDKVGNQTTRTDAENRTTTYKYDALDNLEKIKYPDNSAVTFRYDKNGNLTSMTDPTGPTSQAFDKMNRLKSATDHNGNTVKYSYDLSGNRTNVSVFGNQFSVFSVNYEYDAANRVKAVNSPLIKGDSGHKR